MTRFTIYLKVAVDAEDDVEADEVAEELAAWLRSADEVADNNDVEVDDVHEASSA